MFAPLLKGRVAERLGRGLQNLVQRFKSARDLKNPFKKLEGFLFYLLNSLKDKKLVQIAFLLVK